MIKEFVEQWDKKKGLLREELIRKPPADYKDLVTAVTCILNEGMALWPESVVEVPGDDYQGTNLYIIKGSKYGRYLSKFFMVKVDYGSCSGCDTLQHIQMDLDGDEAIDAYMTLCLHIVQEIKEV